MKIVPSFSLLSSCDGLSLEELHLKHLNLQQVRRKQKGNWKSIQWRGVHGGKEDNQDFFSSFNSLFFFRQPVTETQARRSLVRPWQGFFPPELGASLQTYGQVYGAPNASKQALSKRSLTSAGYQFYCRRTYLSSELCKFSCCWVHIYNRFVLDLTGAVCVS